MAAFSPLQLPARPSLDHLKQQAYDLQRESLAAGEQRVQLADTYHALARRYGFTSWPKLKRYVEDVNAPASSPSELNALAAAFIDAVRKGDTASVRSMLLQDPTLAKLRILGDNRLLGVTYAYDDPKRPSPHDAGRSSTPLHHAAFKSYADIARALLDVGADANAWGYDNNHGVCTPVVLAAWEGSLDVLNLLLERGADPNLYHIQSPLMTALEHRKYDHVQALLAAAAVPNIHDAAALGRIGDLESQLKAEPDLLEARDASRQATPLYFAACLDQPEAIDFLLARGASIEIEHDGGWTPLVAAGYFGAFLAIRRLVERGADLTAAARREYWRVPIGSTVLHFLCGNKDTPPDLVGFLLDHGADVNARTVMNLTPLAIADQHGMEEIAQLLRDRGGIT